MELDFGTPSFETRKIVYTSRPYSWITLKVERRTFYVNTHPGGDRKVEQGMGWSRQTNETSSDVISQRESTSVTFREYTEWRRYLWKTLVPLCGVGRSEGSVLLFWHWNRHPESSWIPFLHLRDEGHLEDDRLRNFSHEGGHKSRSVPVSVGTRKDLSNQWHVSHHTTTTYTTS